MLKKVLILSPAPGFCELIRQLLEDTGGFAPLVVTDPVQAMHLAQKEALALTIMDADIGLKDFPRFVSELRAYAPQTRLIVVPAKEDSNNPQLAQLDANAVLPNPFYLPNLVAAIEQLFGPLVPGASEERKVYGKPTATLNITRTDPEPELAPEWLQDVSKAASYLARLSLESASQAALITRAAKVWAYAGELPEDAAYELAGAISSYVTNGNGTDLARFVHLSATKADYMLYATNLGGEFHLALVFDAQMPFSKMRAHAGQLAKKLAVAPNEGRSDRGEDQEFQPQSSKVVDARIGFGHKEPQPPDEANIQEPNPFPEAPASPEKTTITSNRQPLQATPSKIRYSFVLIPRLPKHKLTGDLAARLNEWLPELSLAYDWRLEHLELRPEFLGWSLIVSNAASPKFITATMSDQLSRRVFAEFVRLAQDNPSGQFWVPDALIVHGTIPSPAQILEYIQLTRKRQGAIR